MLELLVLVLSVYVLLSMLAELFVSMSPDMKHLLTLIDYGVCAVFLTEFFVRLYHAPSKVRFTKDSRGLARRTGRRCCSPSSSERAYCPSGPTTALHTGWSHRAWAIS